MWEGKDLMRRENVAESGLEYWFAEPHLPMANNRLVTGCDLFALAKFVGYDPARLDCRSGRLRQRETRQSKRSDVKPRKGL